MPGISPTLATFLASPVGILVLLWSILWKGIALWKAARRRQLVWYVALVIINTVGILPIIYIFLLAPRQPER